MTKSKEQVASIAELPPVNTAIVIDSSAVVAVFIRESEAEPLLEAMQTAAALAISSATALECGIVLSHRFGRPMQYALELFLLKAGVEQVPFDATQSQLAQQAWWAFGKGRSPAKLNFGDCISYALAQHLRRPLLCKGDDFPLTDLPLVVWRQAEPKKLASKATKATKATEDSSTPPTRKRSPPATRRKRR